MRNGDRVCLISGRHSANIKISIVMGNQSHHNTTFLLYNYWEYDRELIRLILYERGDYACHITMTN